VISGSVNSNGVPIISLAVANLNYRAVIDTGFNGDLELPETLRPRVNARRAFRATSLLAGGVVLEEDVFGVDFPFDGRVVKAEATFVRGDEILIGTKLLREHRLEIDFVARTVRIERALAAGSA